MGMQGMHAQGTYVPALSPTLVFVFCFVFFFFLIFWLHLRHTEVPGPGIESELQL